MTDVTNPRAFRIATRALAALGIVTTTLFGAALLSRGPEPALLPQMAAHPIVMPDGRKFYAQKFEVTVTEWNKCAADKACDLVLRTRPDQDPALTPATGLNYTDTQQYLAWINRHTDGQFRLPTAEEWDVMAQDVLHDAPDPLFSDPALSWASSYLTENLAPRALKPQGSFSTSPHGVADLDGSVWEWTQECYNGATQGIELERCAAFFVGGEHLAAMSYLVRDPARGGCAVGTPPAHLGLRLVSDAGV